MEGKIIKGVGGAYYVQVAHRGIYTCSAKGKFRYEKIKPLVGDNVVIASVEEDKKTANIIEVIKRKNLLIRPEVANVDQALVVFAITDPSPNLNLLDRFLVMMESQFIDTIICFNKSDLVTEKEVEMLYNIYQGAGYKVITTSTYKDLGIKDVKEVLEGKTTVLAGPSGVGKSSLLNIFCPKADMQVGELSQKIKRGKNTTRHSELFYMDEYTFIMDTPGFSSMYMLDFEKEELRFYFPEIKKYYGECKFKECMHINEPGCKVKEALNQGIISKSRYGNYSLIFDEMKNTKKY